MNYILYFKEFIDYNTNRDIVNVLVEVKPVTIKDIARKAGVSYATVSRALNNHPEVNEGTRKRILKIAAEIGYQPNAIARGLVCKQTNTIGLLIPDITNPFYAEVARGIEDAANEVGYTILLCNSNWNEEREERYLNVLIQKQVDGLIIAESSEKHQSSLLETRLKSTVFISRINFANSTSVIIDNITGGRMAVEHLLNKGHQRIAFIGGLEDISANQERLKGYKNALEAHNISINQNYIRNSNFKRESGHYVMKEILKINPKPTAVFAANDLLALGAIQAIKEQGMSIPGDVAVVGFDDIEFASLPEIQLTTVAQPKYNMGKLALLTLVEQIKSKSFVRQKIMLEPELIIRGTT